jgi:hypothetical protein
MEMRNGNMEKKNRQELPYAKVAELEARIKEFNDFKPYMAKLLI